MPVLSIAKSHTGTFYAGLAAQWTLTPSNTGTAATSGTMTITDTLPAGITFIAASGAGWGCSARAKS